MIISDKTSNIPNLKCKTYYHYRRGIYHYTTHLKEVFGQGIVTYMRKGDNKEVTENFSFRSESGLIQGNVSRSPSHFINVGNKVITFESMPNYFYNYSNNHWEIFENEEFQDCDFVRSLKTINEFKVHFEGHQTKFTSSNNLLFKV